MGEELKEKLFTKKEDGWKNLTTSQKEELVMITENYMKFLNKSKIEREFIKNAKELANYAIKTSEGKEMVVLLMHDTYGKEETVKALPAIIKYFKDNGYEFKTLS